MANGKFISYLRVSTQRQGVSGLGEQAQRDSITRFLNGGDWDLIDEFVEIESGRKGSKHRPQLMKALAECKKQKASLIVGKLDRLSRDVRFFLELLDDYGVDIRFAEFSDINPQTDEGRMILVNMANYAEFEGRRIGARTKAALQAAKARGVVLGVAGVANLRPNIEQRQAAADEFAGKLKGVIAGMKARQLSQRAMVDELNQLGIKTARGGQWSLVQLQRVMVRL